VRGSPIRSLRRVLKFGAAWEWIKDDLSHVTWQVVRDGLSNVRKLLTWQVVRGVGELQILTRASYVMLAVVPLLVGVWPSVRLVINKHNEILERKSHELSQMTEKISEQAKTFDTTINTLIREHPDIDLAVSASGAVRNFIHEALSLCVRGHKML
jgi:hypothetical protein